MKQTNKEYYKVRNYKNYAQSGVSIAELAIVVLVIGLLAGIVSVGLNINKASELRNIMSTISSQQVAIENFKAKYSQLPGDFDDAYSYWGADCATESNCNGDNNGDIDESAISTQSESYRLWQHLNLAGFIEGGYTGVGGGSGRQANIGINVPATTRSKGGYFVVTLDSATWNEENQVIGTYILVGSLTPNWWPLNKLFTTSEAYAMDNKMDDGLPDDGKVRGRYSFDGTSWHSSECLSGIYPDREYDRQRKNVECTLRFPIEL